MAGLTAVCAGIAFFYIGRGQSGACTRRGCLAVSLWGFFKIKPLEGKTGTAHNPP